MAKSEGLIEFVFSDVGRPISGAFENIRRAFREHWSKTNKFRELLTLKPKVFRTVVLLGLAAFFWALCNIVDYAKDQEVHHEALRAI